MFFNDDKKRYYDNENEEDAKLAEAISKKIRDGSMPVYDADDVFKTLGLAHGKVKGSDLLLEMDPDIEEIFYGEDKG